MRHAYNKDKTRSIIWKYNKNVTFCELKLTLKIGYNLLHICRVMLVFLFLCCGRCAKPHET